MGVRLCVCIHCGLRWPFGIPLWYLSQWKWRYGFKQYEEAPVWDTIPYRPTSSTGSASVFHCSDAERGNMLETEVEDKPRLKYVGLRLWCLLFIASTRQGCKVLQSACLYVCLWVCLSARKSSAAVEMGDRLATIDMGRKSGEGLLCPFPWGELGPHLTQCRLGRHLPPYHVVS